MGRVERAAAEVTRTALHWVGAYTKSGNTTDGHGTSKACGEFRFTFESFAYRLSTFDHQLAVFANSTSQEMAARSHLLPLTAVWSNKWDWGSFELAPVARESI